MLEELGPTSKPDILKKQGSTLLSSSAIKGSVLTTGGRRQLLPSPPWLAVKSHPQLQPFLFCSSLWHLPSLLVEYTCKSLEHSPIPLLSH